MLVYKRHKSEFQFDPLFHTKVHVQSYNTQLTCQEYKVVTGSVAVQCTTVVKVLSPGVSSGVLPPGGGREVSPGLR